MGYMGMTRLEPTPLLTFAQVPGQSGIGYSDSCDTDHLVPELISFVLVEV